MLLLQSTYRGHLARRFVLHLNKAAARIQGLARGHFTRKRVKAERRWTCARKIQRWFRACVTRDIMFRMKREQGANCLQRVYRGHLGRKSWRFRQQTLAANAIQRCVKGHEGRKSALAEMQRLAIARQKRMGRAAVKFQAIYRGFTCRKWIKRRMPALVLARRIRMVLRLQRAFRGYRGRLAFRMAMQLQEMDSKSAALIPLQALARGHIIRQRLRDEAERVMAEEAASLASSLLLFRQNRSARIIQIGWRAWTAIKYEWAMNRFASWIQIWYRVRRMSSLGRMQRRKIFASATKIQSVCVGHKGRKFFIEYKRNKFATRIQATFRGHMERIVAFQLLRKARERAKKERERKQRELEEERRQLAIIAQSNRGQIEVFVQEPIQSDTFHRPAQIVPEYMKVIAEQEERVKRPTVSNAVLRGATMRSNMSEVRAAGKLKARSDDFGWQTVDPSVDPYEGLDLHVENSDDEADVRSQGETRRRRTRKLSDTLNLPGLRPSASTESFPQIAPSYLKRYLEAAEDVRGRLTSTVPKEFKLAYSEVEEEEFSRKDRSLSPRAEQLTPAEVAHRQRVRRFDEKMRSFRRAAGDLQGSSRGETQDVKPPNPFYEVYTQELVTNKQTRQRFKLDKLSLSRRGGDETST
mmetsp:Transcript_34779/g.78559  ORF Transcript_34779/g.78559 Transcript_34779/m.78559 type:complete len:639 (+) Transcript_34779:641-2557(+)